MYEIYESKLQEDSGVLIAAFGIIWKQEGKNFYWLIYFLKLNGDQQILMSKRLIPQQKVKKPHDARCSAHWQAEQVVQ